MAGPWFVYLRGAKQLIRAVNLDRMTISSEFIGVTNWLYHYDVTAQFSIRHWREKAASPMLEDVRSPSRQADVHANTKAMTEIVQHLSGVSPPLNLMLVQVDIPTLVPWFCAD
jgi:hypothetical protein